MKKYGLISFCTKVTIICAIVFSDHSYFGFLIVELTLDLKKYPKIIDFVIVYFRIMLLGYVKQIKILTYSMDFALSNRYLKVMIQPLEPRIFDEKNEVILYKKKIE